MTLRFFNGQLLFVGNALALGPNCCCCGVECPPSSCKTWETRRYVSPHPLDGQDRNGYFAIQENLLGVAPTNYWAVTGWIKPWCVTPGCNTVTEQPIGRVFELRRTGQIPEFTIEISGSSSNLILEAKIQLRDAGDVWCGIPFNCAPPNQAVTCNYPYHTIRLETGPLSNPCQCIFFGVSYDEWNITTREPRFMARLGPVTTQDTDDIADCCAGDTGCRFRPGNINIATTIGNGTDTALVAFGGGINHLTIWDNRLDEEAMEELSHVPGNWTPGALPGTPVSCTTSIPVAFTLFETIGGVTTDFVVNETTKPKYRWCQTDPTWAQNEPDQCQNKILTYIGP